MKLVIIFTFALLFFTHEPVDSTQGELTCDTIVIAHTGRVESLRFENLKLRDFVSKLSLNLDSSYLWSSDYKIVDQFISKRDHYLFSVKINNDIGYELDDTSKTIYDFLDYKITSLRIDYFAGTRKNINHCNDTLVFKD